MTDVTYQSPWMNEELRIFREKVRHFIADELVPRQAAWVDPPGPDAAAWLAAGRAGILLPDIPREYGGSGGNFAHEAVVREELATAGIHFGTGAHSILAHYLLAYGSPEQKARWLPRLARGELVGAVAMGESGRGSDLRDIRTTARRDGAVYVIHGAKHFVVNGQQAGLVCVAARTDFAATGSRGISLILVEPAGLAGYRTGREKIGMHGQDICDLLFDDIRVPIANLLGTTEGRGFGQMMGQLPYERLSIAIGAVATSERAVGITRAYAHAQKACGKTLIEFRSTRSRLAECRTAAHVGRVFVDTCIALFLAGRFDHVTAAMAKYWLTDNQRRIVDECLQLHGSHGCMIGHPIARLWADSRLQRISAGSNDIVKDIIGWSV